MSKFNDHHRNSGETTFQGAPVIPLNWKGREWAAVQGALVFRTSANRELSFIETKTALEMNVRALRQPDELGVGIIVTDERLDLQTLRDATNKMGADLLWAEPVLLDYGSKSPNDLIFPSQWGLPIIKAVAGWDAWHGDPSTVVLAVLDSGVPLQGGNLCHPDLNDPGRFLLGADVYNQDNDPADDNGHGTHVVGIAAATRNNGQGIAGLWPGNVLVVKVFNSENVGANTTFYDGTKAAVKFANDHQQRLIINYSGGGPDSDCKRTAVEYARDNGALIVAAGGNDQRTPVDFPAAFSTQYPHVIGVGGINEARQAFGSQGEEITVVAPGAQIASTLPNYEVTLNDGSKSYGFLSGTSQATPLVAGLAALVWSQWPSLDAREVRNKIIQSADPLPGPIKAFGHGMIDVEAALS